MRLWIEPARSLIHESEYLEGTYALVANAFRISAYWTTSLNVLGRRATKNFLGQGSNPRERGR